MQPSLSRWTALLLAGSLVLAGCPNKKKKKDDEDVDPNAIGAQDVDVRLSVVAITPSLVAAGEPADATLRGSGFAEGAKVMVGATQVPASYISDAALGLDLPALAEGRYDVEVVNPNGDRSILRQGLRVEADALSCAQVVVYFDLDSDDLRSDSVDDLTGHLGCLRDEAEVVIIEGHADERGTTDYNLALGQRRANSVLRWLTSRGVPPSRIKTLTFGEEDPADPRSTEEAWAKNRRAEILLQP